MAHKLPPPQCTANLPTWTDLVVTPNATFIRKVHMDELRSYIKAEQTRRSLTSTTFTDPTLTANVTETRATHVNELRTAITNCKTGYSTTGYCPGDNSLCADFGAAVVARVTDIIGSSVTSERNVISSLMTGCICETEQCQYCVDCGYQYFAGCGYCGCKDRCGNDGHPCSEHWVYLCGSINTVAGTPAPFKTWNGSVSTPQDGYVPWDWGAGIPVTAVAWRSPHASWNCKCDPYTWSA